MAKYLEEYLIALGFDVNSEQGQEYLRTVEDLDKEYEKLQRSDKSVADQSSKTTSAQKDRILNTQKEIDSVNDLSEAKRKLNQTPEQEPAPQKQTTPNPAEAPETPTESPQRDRRTTTKPNAPRVEKPSEDDTKHKKKVDNTKQEINILGDLERSVRQVGSAWAQLQEGNIFAAFIQGASGVRAFNNYIENVSSAFGESDKKAAAFGKTLSGIFGTGVKQAGELGEAGASAGEAVGGAAAAGAIGVTAGVAAAVALTAKAAYDMGEGIAEANTNVETMARQLWITNDAAWKLNNTLGAMGKSTADLNTIAINPVLNEQFKTLQEYQKTQLQLPSDYQQTAEQYAKEVGESRGEQKLALNNLMQKIGYESEKALKPYITWTYDFSKNVLNWLGGNKSPTTANPVQNQMNPSSYAPQTSNNTTYQGANVTYAPHIEVHAESSSPDDIASAVSDSVQQNFAEAQMIKNLQGLSR